MYHNVYDPKVLDSRVWTNSVDPDQTSTAPSGAVVIRVYTVCHSVCIFWTHHSVVKRHSSNFMIITAIVRVSKYLGFLW